MFSKSTSLLERIAQRYWVVPKLKRELARIQQRAWETHAIPEQALREVAHPLLVEELEAGNTLARAELARREATRDRFAIWCSEQGLVNIKPWNTGLRPSKQPETESYQGDEWLQTNYPEFPIPRIEEFYPDYPDLRQF